MSEITEILAALQFGDSFFPSGAVSFSWGLEGLADRGVMQSPQDLEAFVIGQLHARWANFDRPAVIAAHEAHGDVNAVITIDDMVEIQCASAELRSASRRMGDVMLSMFARIGFVEAARYREVIRAGRAHGHLPPLQGYLWATAGIPVHHAVALSSHTFCTSLLSAAIRLGCISHVDAQHTLLTARRVASEISRTPVPPIDELSSWGLEAEIAVTRHAKNHLRVFAN